jgi:hypothetical protein
MNALRKWRRPERLTKGRSDPLYLPATPDPSDPRIVWYATKDVLAFCRRNDRYATRLLATAYTPVSLLLGIPPHDPIPA